MRSEIGHRRRAEGEASQVSDVQRDLHRRAKEAREQTGNSVGRAGSNSRA